VAEVQVRISIDKQYDTKTQQTIQNTTNNTKHNKQYTTDDTKQNKTIQNTINNAKFCTHLQSPLDQPQNFIKCTPT
jgi:hypothetical protein